jgi:L-asparaginase
MATPSAALPRVHLIATGGTIAATGTAAAYRAGSLPLADLLAAVPELARLARITGEQLCNLGSQDIGPQQWLALARRVHELAGDATLAGVVVTHGTDTMEETAYFLELVLPGAMPVVLTGAMRPATAAHPDGPRNLADAVAVAASPAARGRGVLVVMAGAIHGARAVRKLHTTALAALGSVATPPLGICGPDGPRFTEPSAISHQPSAVVTTLPTALPRVDIIHAYAGMGREHIDHAVASGARGVVLAGVGAGNAAADALAALAAAARAGIAVVRSSRVAGGGVARGIEVDDDACGFIAAHRLDPQQARVLLMVALAAGEGAATLQGRFDDASSALDRN